MPQSLSQVFVHGVFSTWHRTSWLDSDLRKSLFAYIANQNEHHNNSSFQDEFRQLMKEQGIEIDERYVWD